MPLQGITMPPPSGGLNLVAPLDQMEPQDALELVNVFPGAGSPTLRNGYQRVSTTGASIGAAIRTTSELVLADASRQLIVATGTKLYSMRRIVKHFLLLFFIFFTTNTAQSYLRQLQHIYIITKKNRITNTVLVHNPWG